MAQKSLFNTVSFGGFDKEQVLEFIKTTIDENEAKEDAYKAKIMALSKTIDSQKAEIESLTNRNTELSSAISNTSGSSVATGKDTIANSIIFAKEASDRLISETKQYCNDMIKKTEVECRQKKMMIYQGNEQQVDKYEKRLDKLIEHTNTLIEANNLIVEKAGIVSKELNNTHERMLSELTPESTDKHE